LHRGAGRERLAVAERGCRSLVLADGRGGDADPGHAVCERRPNGPRLFAVGTVRVPVLRPNPTFEKTQISLRLPAGLGQPWQSLVWKFEP
jgi:hypothetical protein